MDKSIFTKTELEIIEDHKDLIESGNLVEIGKALEKACFGRLYCSAADIMMGIIYVLEGPKSFYWGFGLVGKDIMIYLKFKDSSCYLTSPVIYKWKSEFSRRVLKSDLSLIEYDIDRGFGKAPIKSLIVELWAKCEKVWE